MRVPIKDSQVRQTCIQTYVTHLRQTCITIKDSQERQPSSSHSSSTQPQLTLQPLTITRAVRRCVSVQHTINSTPLITSHNLGRLILDRGQAEQPTQATQEVIACQAEQKEHKVQRGATQPKKTRKSKPKIEENPKASLHNKP